MIDTKEAIIITKNTIMNANPQLSPIVPEYVKIPLIKRPNIPVSITDCGIGAYLLITYALEKEIYKGFVFVWLFGVLLVDKLRQIVFHFNKAYILGFIQNFVCSDNLNKNVGAMNTVAVKIGCSIDDIAQRRQICECLESFAAAVFSSASRNNGVTGFSPVWSYIHGFPYDNYVLGRYEGLSIDTALLCSSAVVWMPALGEENLFARLCQRGYAGRRITVLDNDILHELNLEGARDLRSSSQQLVIYGGSLREDVSGGNYAVFTGKFGLLISEILKELHEL